MEEEYKTMLLLLPLERMKRSKRKKKKMLKEISKWIFLSVCTLLLNCKKKRRKKKIENLNKNLTKEGKYIGIVAGFMGGDLGAFCVVIKILDCIYANCK